MRLSEAIKLGAMMKPQATNGYLESAGATCALGAAADAVGFDLEQLALDGDYRQLRERWPFLNTYVTHPHSGIRRVLVDLIWDLNDNQYPPWTREQIADWVATIEPPEVSSDGTQLVADCAVDPVVQAQHVTSTRDE